MHSMIEVFSLVSTEDIRVSSKAFGSEDIRVSSIGFESEDTRAS